MPVAKWFIFGLDFVSKKSEGITVMKKHVNLVVRSLTKVVVYF